MLVRHFLSRWWVVLFCAFVVQAEAQAVRVPGRIVAANVQGLVTHEQRATASSRTLKTGDELTQDSVILTGEAARVVLVFSNGASVSLGARASLVIDEFLQDPFAEEFAIRTAAAEPTSSTTSLRLNRGELVGNVKHLNLAQGSSFRIDTAVGAAGIRGTTFRLVLLPDDSGRVTFSLTTAEGEVVLTDAAQNAVAVAAGNQIQVEVEATIDPATGAITIVGTPQVSALLPIPPETQQAIEAALQTLLESNRSVIFDSSVPAGETTDGGAAAASGEAEKQADPAPVITPVELPPTSPN